MVCFQARLLLIHGNTFFPKHCLRASNNCIIKFFVFLSNMALNFLLSCFVKNFRVIFLYFVSHTKFHSILQFTSVSILHSHTSSGNVYLRLSMPSNSPLFTLNSRKKPHVVCGYRVMYLYIFINIDIFIYYIYSSISLSSIEGTCAAIISSLAASQRSCS